MRRDLQFKKQILTTCGKQIQVKNGCRRPIGREAMAVVQAGDDAAQARLEVVVIQKDSRSI